MQLAAWDRHTTQPKTCCFRSKKQLTLEPGIQIYRRGCFSLSTHISNNPTTHWHSPTIIMNFLQLSSSQPAQPKECTPSLLTDHWTSLSFINLSLLKVTKNTTIGNLRELIAMKTTRKATPISLLLQ
jgi:hypothetical protein